MFKKVIFSLILCMSFSGILKAEWISFEESHGKQTQPQVEILEHSLSGITLKINLTGFKKSKIISDGKALDYIDLLTESFKEEAGAPAVPYLSKVLAIPDNQGVSAEVIATGKLHTFKNVDLAPARESWVEGFDETPYVKNEEIYTLEKNYPQKMVNISKPSIFRDFRISRLSVFPVQYNPANKELNIYSSVIVKVNYGSGKNNNIKNSLQKELPLHLLLYIKVLYLITMKY